MRRDRLQAATRLQGTQLTLAAVTENHTGIPVGTNRIRLYGITNDYLIMLHPAILGVYVFDATQLPGTTPWITRGRVRSLTLDLTDDIPGDQSGSALSRAVGGTFLYVGFATPYVNYLYVQIPAGATNGTAASMYGEYWDGERYLSLPGPLTDDTDNQGDSMGKSGAIEWQTVERWKPGLVNPLLHPSALPADCPVAYWVRFYWDATLDAVTAIQRLYPALSGIVSSMGARFKASTEYEIDIEKFAVGGLSAYSTGGATLDINFMINESPWAFPAGGFGGVAGCGVPAPTADRQPGAGLAQGIGPCGCGGAGGLALEGYGQAPDGLLRTQGRVCAAGGVGDPLKLNR
jgi:hypothetical protein